MLIVILKITKYTSQRISLYVVLCPVSIVPSVVYYDNNIPIFILSSLAPPSDALLIIYLLKDDQKYLYIIHKIQ